ncbi:hypothetical protein METH_21400 (plasmid) [Leisingera methylohalidivorans DSM 14336]|uniref:Uncharacterized protein n=1 Tax=Leisingera methylohalidivorans DSM 14336 TaxID=999552 RepID=V9VZL6_9RHOB|nr:hypothetical protein METH_21400 [Leisingera methylohalidivorans DSM 14336]
MPKATINLLADAPAAGTDHKDNSTMISEQKIMAA